MIFFVLSHTLVAIEWYMYFMELLLNINDHSVVMHAMYNRGVLVIEKLVPFDYLQFNDFFQ